MAPKEPKEKGKRGNRTVTAPQMRLRCVLSKNIAALMDRDYPRHKFKSESARQKEAAKHAGVSWSTVQRALDPKNGQTLDVLTDFAILFHLTAAELLNPALAEDLKSQERSQKASSRPPANRYSANE